MPIPKDIKWITFDVYGTLIDWESGVYDAFQIEAARTDFKLVDKPTLIALFNQYQQEIMGGSYELYAEVLRRVALKISDEIDWDLEPSRSNFLPDSVVRWKPYREANAAL